MDKWPPMIRLAQLLRGEWEDGCIDEAEAYRLACELQPLHPEIHTTLASIRTRMARSRPI